MDPNYTLNQIAKGFYKLIAQSLPREGFLIIQHISGQKLAAKLKFHNREINKSRIGIEHVFGKLKAFKILCEKYRNRGKRIGLRFNLIAGIYNFLLAK